MRALLGVAHNAFTESIRQPVFVVLLLAVALVLILNPALSARHTISQTGAEFDKLLVDLGLSMMFVAGLMLASFTATGVLTREIENKTVLTVISKPVGRPLFLVGKYLGVLGAVALAYWVWSVIFLLTIRHGVLYNARIPHHWPVITGGLAAGGAALLVALWCNYFYRWVFGATLTTWLAGLLPVAYVATLGFDRGWEALPFGSDVDGQLLIAILLVMEALAVLVAIAIAASTRLGQAMTLVACAVMFLLGLSSDFLLGRMAEGSAIGRLLYALPLNTQFHWLAEALAQGNPVGPTYVALVTAYSALYTIAVLALAVALFQTREVS